MNGHAHEFSPPGAPPAAICPGIEVLVHRRATELIADRPRRRVATLSSVGGVAVAAVCAVLVMVIGAPSGSGLLSPRQAVAAMVQSLDGDGILHWVSEEKVSGVRNPAAWPERTVHEQWLDLSSGDSHTITETYRAGSSAPERRGEWIGSGIEWSAMLTEGEALTIHRKSTPLGTAVDEIRATLARADNGESEIAAAGEHAGHPLVVVTERRGEYTRRVWITREDVPRLVRVEASGTGSSSSPPIVTTTTTSTWQILPRTPEALTDVQIPTDAKRVP